MTDKAKPTAAQTYQQHHADIASVLEWIGMEIERHQEQTAREGVTWSHVGDIARVRKLLIQTLAGIADTETDEVEVNLAELFDRVDKE